MNQCEVCGIEITGNGKTCSPRCRVALSRQKSVTGLKSVTTEIKKSVTFRFTVGYNRKSEDVGYDEATAKFRKVVRTAKYWYDVPLGAIPVLEKDWPEMPDFMNGREYFLWWKNDFKEQNGEPVILNPFPELKNVTYAMGGESSRRWGA